MVLWCYGAMVLRTVLWCDDAMGRETRGTVRVGVARELSAGPSSQCDG